MTPRTFGCLLFVSLFAFMPTLVVFGILPAGYVAIVALAKIFTWESVLWACILLALAILPSAGLAWGITKYVRRREGTQQDKVAIAALLLPCLIGMFQIYGFGVHNHGIELSALEIYLEMLGCLDHPSGPRLCPFEILE